MAAINTGRLWLGAVAGAVVWILWSGVVNFAVLAPRYQVAQDAGMLLKAPRYNFFVGLWFLVLFLLTLVGAWLYAGVRATYGAGPKTALKVGVLLGFATGFPMSFSTATWAPLERVFPLWWMLELWLGAVLATFVAAWLYRDR
ncbi:MAG: hypothetical protein HYX75_01915 [Acidobacteria bacterium]|nr:hypothetical protein [Acidobacteriota bacterium]